MREDIIREIVQILQIKVMPNRENLHAAYNGGHWEDKEHKAFHHGMDTVCNIMDGRDLDYIAEDILHTVNFLIKNKILELVESF